MRWIPLVLGLAAAAAGASPALGRPFQIGEVEGVANVELSYGLLARVEDRDPELVAIVNGGSAASANFDDGDLNYDEGIVSNMLQSSGEIAARWGAFGVYVRGIAYYDFETELSDRERTSLSGDAEHYVGTYAELLDYYLAADFRVRGMPVHLRVGDQVLNWGESTFLRFGVQTVSPLDLVAILRPASSTRDVQIPQGMLWAAANVTEEVAIEGYYQYEWQRVRTPPVGWFFSDNDTIGAEGLNVAMVGGGLFSDLGTDLDAAFALPPGTLGFDPDFMRVPGRGSHEPSNQGQGGFTLQAILPRFNSTKLALHFINYHNRLPLVSARTADAAAAAATSPAAVAARAAALAPIYEGEGLPPAEAALAAAVAASTLTVGEYASEASYFVTYPEDIQMLGFSFNTATLRTGTLISGEVSHHFDWLPTLLALVAAPARGAVSEAEAARLEADLTPMGAERAGNAEGTIPAWTGGITAPPPDYRPGAHHPNPYPGDPRLYTVTAADLEARGSLLCDGQKALLRAHPESWRLHVYPTRRSASFPEWVYQSVRANATRARVVLAGKGSVEGARVGPPFPIPQSGIEAIWNHNLRWRGARIARSEGSAAVTRRGSYRVVLSAQTLGLPYAAKEPDAFGKEYPNVLFAIKSKTIAPSRIAGDGALVIEPIDQTRDPRRSWLYSRDLRRVFRLPWVAYDFPAPNTDGLRTVDDFWLFNGPPDRFEWELLGKRELLIPYNAYRLHGSDVGPADILLRSHIDPELARYELHRVWVVQATLKPGERHVYSRRVFYVDEDSWQIAVAESYDLEGRLWRVNEVHALNYYDVPVLWSTLEVYHDLIRNRYLVSGLDNGRNTYRFSEGSDPREFSPNALSYEVR